MDRFWINSYSSYTKKRWISSVTQNTKWTLKHYTRNGLNASVCIIQQLMFALYKLTNIRYLIRYPKGTTLSLRLCTYSTTIPDLWAGSEKVQGGRQSPDTVYSSRSIHSFKSPCISCMRPSSSTTPNCINAVYHCGCTWIKTSLSCFCSCPSSERVTYQ